MAVGRVAGGTSPGSPARRRPGGSGPRTPGGRTGPGSGRSRAFGRSAGRGPFAVLVVLMLAGGLIALLMLNTALNQGSFTLSQLQQRTTALTDERQGLQQQIGAWSAPGALSARAQQLGMVPGGNPAFLQDNGSVLGRPKPLDGSAALPTATATPTPAGTAKATPTATTTATATVTTTATATATATATPTAASNAAAHQTATGAGTATKTGTGTNAVLSPLSPAHPNAAAKPHRAAVPTAAPTGH